MSKTTYYVFSIILGLLVVIGFIAYLQGHGATGLHDFVPWGLNVAAFAFFVGASAGATIIGLLVHGFGRDDYKPIGIRAVLVSLLSLIAALLFILLDAGKPFTVLLVPWVFRNTGSVFFITSLSYYLFMAILLVELYYLRKVARGDADERDRKRAKWLALIAAPYALWVVHAFTGSIFGVIKAKEFWHSSLQPPHFVVSALVTGTALMILVVIITSKTTGRELLAEKTLEHSGKLLAFFLAVNFFFDFFDMLVLRYGEVAGQMEAWSLLTGRYAHLLILNIGGLVVALLILLFKRGRQTRGGLTVASILAIAAVAAYRYTLVVVGSLVPKVPDLHGTSNISYSPTWAEISVVVGVISLLMLIYMGLSRAIPLQEASS
ncbi:MAG: polysulfide reductase NrfD [Deltaproteobacteria bacterium]|nr:MAG: polysulfide reductase NrfD [Deltaproteobacteria bacterium]